MARMTKRESEKGKKKTCFKDGVGTPCLATSRTNNRTRVNRWQDESSNNNDNKVI